MIWAVYIFRTCTLRAGDPNLVQLGTSARYTIWAYGATLHALTLPPPVRMCSCDCETDKSDSYLKECIVSSTLLEMDCCCNTAMCYYWKMSGKSSVHYAIVPTHCCATVISLICTDVVYRMYFSFILHLSLLLFCRGTRCTVTLMKTIWSWSRIWYAINYYSIDV